MKGIDSRRGHMLECLERSYYECGQPKQHSGFGLHAVGRRGPKDENVMAHIFSKYKDVDNEFAEALAGSSAESFPIKRLYNLCQIQASVWSARKSKTDSAKLARSDTSTSERGCFPYVDERATVLSELTKSAILQTRHRVNSNAHPRWAIRTIRRRRRKQLTKAKKRSISQEATRELQARLLAAKSQKSDVGKSK